MDKLNPELIPCQSCGETFIQTHTSKKYCGHRYTIGSCAYKERLKRTKKYQIEWRNSPAYEKHKAKLRQSGYWKTNVNNKQKRRLKIISRDNNTCQMCFYYNPNAEIFDVDHKDSNNSNNDKLNLWTLCPICHRIKTIEDRKNGTGGWLKTNTVKTKTITIYIKKEIQAWKQGRGN